MKPAPRILLVDDANTVLMAARMMLKDKGFELSFARDGKEALLKAEAEKPDLIVMDVMMPEMDGLEACRRIRAHPSLSQTPIILLTTRGEAVNKEAGLESGATEYLTKPFDGPTLIARIRSLVEKRGTQGGGGRP